MSATVLVDTNSTYEGSVFSIDESSNDSSGGLSGALLALVFWVKAINDMQEKFADLAAQGAVAIGDLSDKQKTALEDINKQIKALDPKDDHYNIDLTDLQQQYNITQQQYDGRITQAQTRMEAKTNFVSDLAKMTTGDYTNLGSICQISANLASDLK
jgi:hypothetical protein